ncbi:uncharacterized protein LOC110856609 [Folsomia candida]|uniref:uncharacterized protein LOC110856609 n=1 Tax=Folsomia candida TaxID=158441 RepID=UPI000B8F1584|nr:uncharacterized protein LOC110856609 [Folsomia candida]XP_021960790.1 uncharacterized protein LOC110856609 [Folsomia candida]XP_021960791.1 uncharacterized protein LOC110856609 [Folsomia candida]
MNSFKFMICVTLVQLISGSETDVGGGVADNRQNGYEIFVGKGSTSLYFILQTRGDWMYALNYCHTHNFAPGRISTERDFEIVSNFIKSNGLPEANQSIWLPATDHGNEGTFRWLDRFDEVTVGNWSGGAPSGDRSLNCLKINSDGLYQDDSCERGRRAHYALCAIENMHYNDQDNNYVQTAPKKLTDLSEDEIRGLRPIGDVANKLYYVDDTEIMEKSWLDGVDFCHENGMRIASPETVEEINFLENFANEEANAGRDALFHIGATDMMSMSCSRGNTKFRLFGSGKDVISGTGLDGFGGGWWYRCAFMTTTEFRASDCISGAQFRIICEVEDTSVPSTTTVSPGPICEPGQYFAPHQDCRFYYVCNEETPTLAQCPNGLYWNQNLTTCDFPGNVGECVGGTRSPLDDS